MAIETDFEISLCKPVFCGCHTSTFDYGRAPIKIELPQRDWLHFVSCVNTLPHNKLSDPDQARSRSNVCRVTSVRDSVDK